MRTPFDAMRDVGGRVVIAWSSRGHRVVIAWSSQSHRVGNRVAKYGSGEICCVPWVTGLTRQRVDSAQRRVSIGKKTVGRALRASV
jgi:hypothetical protein